MKRSISDKDFMLVILVLIIACLMWLFLSILTVNRNLEKRINEQQQVLSSMQQTIDNQQLMIQTYQKILETGRNGG